MKTRTHRITLLPLLLLLTATPLRLEAGEPAAPAAERPLADIETPFAATPASESREEPGEEPREEPPAPETAAETPQPAAAEADDSEAAMNIEAESVTISPRGMRLSRRFLPTRRRIDREINKNRFVFKGKTMCGLTVSYGTLSTDDADMFPVFEGINLSGNMTTVNPFVGYFYKDNQCIGVRFGYTHLSGKLNSLGINLGEQNDLDIDIPWLDLSSDRFSFGVFHRSYVPIDEKGRFGAFGEFELSFTTGENTFAYEAGDSHKYTASDNMTVKVWFNPGVAVYAFPNVCATISFGLGGFKYTRIKQYNEAGEPTGSRNYSKMNFRLNLADIKIGMTIHLWNKKKGDRT